MRLVVAAVGRMRSGPERELVDLYLKRLQATGRGIGLGPVDEVEIDEAKARNPTARRDDEAERLSKRLDGRAPGQRPRLILLDEAGSSLTSDAFATLIARARDDGTAALAFAIGGPDGHGQALRDSAAKTLSFGAQTLPHKLVRVLLAEQLYRASTILSGHPYHRE